VLNEELIPRLMALAAFDPHQFYEELRGWPGSAFAKAGVEGDNIVD
jgi:hypothetical protein